MPTGRAPRREPGRREHWCEAERCSGTHVDWLSIRHAALSRLMKKCLTDVLAEQMLSVVGATSRLGIAFRVVSRISGESC
jgi:hypothetical protein